MYRIFCESYENFIKSIDNKSHRIQMAKPIELIINTEKYKEEKIKQSEIYKKVSDLMYFMKENVNRFPKLKAFLWTLDSREIKAEKYNISDEEELEEQTKLINSFLKLEYWY